MSHITLMNSMKMNSWNLMSSSSTRKAKATGVRRLIRLIKFKMWTISQRIRVQVKSTLALQMTIYSVNLRAWGPLTCLSPHRHQEQMNTSSHHSMTCEEARLSMPTWSRNSQLERRAKMKGGARRKAKFPPRWTLQCPARVSSWTTSHHLSQ